VKRFKVYDALKMLAENPHLKFTIKQNNVITTLEPKAISWGYEPNNDINTMGYYEVDLNSIAILEEEKNK
jgi:hypothetical protein